MGLKEFFQCCGMDIEVCAEADNGETAWGLIVENEPDVELTDIKMPKMDGLELTKKIVPQYPDMKIVFVTAYSEYAIQAFELGVEDYVMKPFSKKRLKKVVDRLLAGGHTESGRSAETPRRIAINSNNKTIFEDVKNIIYIETYNRGCKVYTLDNEYNDSRTIGEYEKKLGGGHFFRIHKSYLINTDKVKEVFPWGNNSFSLRMQGYENNILPISRDKTKVLRQMLES